MAPESRVEGCCSGLRLVTLDFPTVQGRPPPPEGVLAASNPFRIQSSSRRALAPTTARALHAAQDRAAALFRAIEEKRLIRPGETEEGLSRAIFDLASSELGVSKHWHRRVIRSGPHTRMLFRELPPDRTIEEDDIVSLDLAPVFGELEADFGRTYVLGDDPEKLRLARDLAHIFRECQELYAATPAITGRELFAYVDLASKRRGWTFGGLHAGHLIGGFPFSPEERNHARNRVRPDNEWPMAAPGPNGEARHWILELLLLDPSGSFGGFYEELLVPKPTGGARGLTTLRDVTEDDLPILFEHQREPDANRMAAWPARSHGAFMAHWRTEATRAVERQRKRA